MDKMSNEKSPLGHNVEMKKILTKTEVETKKRQW
jgi:hypothetical protein